MVKLLAVLAVPAALVAGVASLGVVVVDVREGGPAGTHIVVPVPLVLAQTALMFVPEEKARLKMERAEQYMPLAREVLDALAQAPDAELVRVEEPGEQVVITKVGRHLRVTVHHHNDDVTVNVPLGLARAALPDDHGRLHMMDLAASLEAARFTDLVDVHSGNDHVKVTVW